MDTPSTMKESLILHWFFNLVDNPFNLLENFRDFELSEDFDPFIPVLM